uniref:Carboxynorspermidine/carboxyspermidine decarboxylase n=1 Tax=uncultured Prevotella sp. TaxID=159272 RepID=A0A6G8F238_9BACT|nr:carboxynorspermidine decarboxylase [uncultured Prevotella sp.]
MEKYHNIKQPTYIVEEEKLRNNLAVISKVSHDSGVQVILAFKAFALWKTFPIFREYIDATTASSLCEARLAYEEFGTPAHTYSPAYTDNDIGDIARMSSHLTFNSLSQYQRFHTRVHDVNKDLEIGLRINPEYSEVETMLYNPCAPGTRFGIRNTVLPAQLPDDISGFHCHCHCESGSEVFERSLAHIEEKFSKWFPQLKWINFGGGHLMTREGYDIPRLVSLLKGFRSRYPWLKVILEPGSAFAWQTGVLVSHVEDIVEDEGIRTAILDVSFTCHMPDCLEMPYWPKVRGAECTEGAYGEAPHTYRLGGNSCLSGDWMQSWQFDHELQIGETIVFEDMIHYTTVKTNTFNGISHPAIAIQRTDGTVETLRAFSYEDYRDRMD